MKSSYDIITIGGSAGSLPAVQAIIDALPTPLHVPVVIVLHRLRNVQSEMSRLLSLKKKISEPEDKEKIRAGCMYLAPQNYHLLVEADKTFMLDYSEPVHYSRPSINMTFSSVAEVYGNRAMGILLSGANADGADGLCQIMEAGGLGIVQDPVSAAFSVMPQSAIDRCPGVHVLTIPYMIDMILQELK